MLAFFRRLLSSWVAVALLGIIMVAFIVTGVGTPGGGLVGGGVGGDAVATVGGKPVTIAEVATRAQSSLTQARQQQPDLTMPAFLSAIGGVAPIVEEYVGARVLGGWAEKHGITASEKLIGGEIASIPAFQGVTGAFDEARMNAVLGQQRLSFATLHDGIREDLVRRQMLVPLTMGAMAPAGLLNQYAMLLLDRREGVIGLVPAKLDGLPAPSEADIAGWYKANVARYSLPERRVVRYAAFGPESVTPPAPTDAEIAAAYKADAAKYAASETRTVSQVVLPDEAAAKGFAARMAGGTPFTKAAADAGFAAGDIALGAITRDALARTASPAVAGAAFALAAGGTTSPIKTALGWSIVHVDAITSNPARSLDQARGEIAAALAKTKAQKATADLVQAVQDAVSDGASFADVVKKHNLQVVTTPPLLPNGTAPALAGFKPDATLTALLKPANDAGPDDQPTVETVAPDHYALLSVASVVAAAPVPLAEAHARVVQDLIAQRAADRAHATAQAILAKVRGGQAMAAAFAAAGLPPPQTAGGTQVDLARAGNNVPPVLRTLFRLTAGKTELSAAPGGGWFVVHLDRIVPGDPAAVPALVAATRGEVTRNIGEEYAQQFANAARAEVAVKRSPAGEAKLEQQLRGKAPSGE